MHGEVMNQGQRPCGEGQQSANGAKSEDRAGDVEAACIRSIQEAAARGIAAV